MRRTAFAILAACLMFSLVLTCGCTANAPAVSPEGSENTVVDGSGAVLKIPGVSPKIASVYAVSVPFIVALDLGDSVVAVNAKSRFWTDNVSGLNSAGSVGRGAVDLEALAELSPGVLVHRSNDSKTVEAVSGKLGIDVLCITVEDFDDIKYTLTMMGKYFGKEERASEVCDWLDGKFAAIDKIVSQIPEDERVTALVMGSEPGRIAGGDMLQSWMIEKAGGSCVAGDISDNRNWTNVGVETIFQWNPDFLFCTSSTPLDYSVDSLYGDSAWSAMTVVKNRDIYQIPSKTDSWDMPGISCALATMYMLSRMYPDYFSTEQLEAEIDDYYNFLFGKTFDREYLGYDLEN